ncbi:hypothetical protein I4U23_017499 [Adineta vaga]|nr:hypothetical protein I4U23_017499 [Adineta vaga]
MFINSLLFITIILDTVYSFSDSNQSVSLRSRRHGSQQIEYIKVCIDHCITSSANTETRNVYKLHELRKMCSELCEKEANRIDKLPNQHKVIDYHRSLQAMSSKQHDCELKCFVNNSSLRLKQRKELCRQQCARF